MCVFVTYYAASKMKGLATPATGVLLVSLWLHCFLMSCQAVDYDYSPTGPNGPAHWGDLNPNWVQCKIGSNQTPIDITLFVPQPPQSLNLVYATTPVDAKIYNDGHTPKVDIVDPNSGKLIISGVTYFLQGFHFHIPSEHKILHFSFKMEMHLVHKSAGGQLAVVALLYNLGLPDEFLTQFFGNLPLHTSPDVKTPIKIKLPVIGPHPYFRYNGSLTTPPCDEGVVWTIINSFPTLSIEQLQQLQAAQPGDNARPIQNTNGRTVYWFP